MIGGAGLGAALPLGCASEATVRNSLFIPTPDRPLTPADDFYVNHCCGTPNVAESAWRLSVDGLVGRRLHLARGDLDAFAPVSRELTMECIGNSPDGGLLSSAAFEGVLLGDVLGAAGLEDDARGLYFTGADGYVSFLPVAVAEDAILVTSLGGEPLTREHGAPVRAIFPGRYGMKCVKWIQKVTATREWHTHGVWGGISYAIEGMIPLRSRIDSPRDGSRVTTGTEIEVRGLALAAGVGVDRVEVRADGGWEPATVTYEGSADLWTLWSFRWTPPDRGRHVLSVRAWDANGRTQRTEPEFLYDSGAVHSVRVLSV